LHLTKTTTDLELNSTEYTDRNSSMTLLCSSHHWMDASSDNRIVYSDGEAHRNPDGSRNSEM